MIRVLFLILYYGFATYLPDSYSPVVGKISNSIRVFLCRRMFKKCGKKEIIINRKAYFGTGKELEIDDFSSIGAETILPNNIVIGKYVMMAPHVQILTNNHCFDRVDVPICFQDYSPHQRIVIEDDCWIGQRALIMPNRNLKKGTIVAAGAVVTKDFEEYSIIGGNPAKLIRKRI